MLSKYFVLKKHLDRSQPLYRIASLFLSEWCCVSLSSAISFKA